MRYEPDRCLLRQILNRQKKTQRWLAEKVSMPETQISDYINNRTTMGYATAVNIARALDVNPESLYEWITVNSKLGE